MVPTLCSVRLESISASTSSTRILASYLTMITMETNHFLECQTLLMFLLQECQVHLSGCLEEPVGWSMAALKPLLPSPSITTVRCRTLLAFISHTT